MKIVVLLCAALSLGLVFGCETVGGGPTPGVGQVEGRVYFIGGGVAGAEIRLRPYVDGVLGEAVVETTTAPDGTYLLKGNIDEGDYVVEASLGGLEWYDPLADREGRFETGDRLLAPVLGFKRIAKRYASVTPFSTLAFAAGDSRRSAGIESGLADAVIGMGVHLSIDLIETPILDERGGALIDAVAHALLVDSFTSLAAKISQRAGIDPGTDITAAQLLAALLDDAAGPTDPGVYDGHGASGQSRLDAGLGYDLDGETLRSDLAASLLALVEDPEGEWSGFSPTVVQDLRRVLTCSASVLFPTCETVSLDMTPPEFGEPSPLDGETLSGFAVVTITVTDPESGVRDLTVTPAGGVEPLLVTARDGLDKWRYTIDTTRFSGDSLVLLAEATSEGGDSSQRITYALDNVGSGVLPGIVSGARNLRIVAEGVRPAGLEPLGETTTDEGGAFSLEISEWDGAVLLTAHGINGGQSEYFDRNSGQWVTWRARDTMSTMLPTFNPENPNTPRVVLSILGDLAYARAVEQTADGGAALVSEYTESLELLAEHFNLSAEALPIWRLLPTPVGAALGRPLDDVDYLAVGEACLHAQAASMASRIFPATPYNFTALDLLKAWRADVAADGMLDGRVGTTDLVFEGEGGLTARLPDGFRGDLAVACASWLVGDESPADLSTRDFIEWLQEMAARVSILFNTAAHSDPQPFDREGPQLLLQVEALTPGMAALEKGDGWLVGGEIDVQALATDTVAGPVSVEVGIVDEAGEPIELPADALTVSTDGQAGSGRPETIRWAATLDTTRLPDGFVFLHIVATDRIENVSEQQIPLEIDNTAPTVTYEVDGAQQLADGWRTNAASIAVTIILEDANGPTVEATLDGVGVANVAPANDGVGVILLLPNDDGTVDLVTTATDVIGNRSVVTQPIHVDRTAPASRYTPRTVIDESAYRAERVGGEVVMVLPADAPTTTLNDGALISKLQVTWDENVPTLSLVATDDGPTADVAEALQVVLRINDQEHRLTGAELAAFALTPERLGIDPIGSPPAANFPIAISGQIIDRAGNTSSIVPLRFTLNVLPPPVLIEVTQADGPDALWNLTFEEGSLSQLFGEPGRGNEVGLRRYTISNPSGIPVYIRISTSEATITVDTTAIVPSTVIGGGGEVRIGMIRGAEGEDRLGHAVQVSSLDCLTQIGIAGPRLRYDRIADRMIYETSTFGNIVTHTYSDGNCSQLPAAEFIGRSVSRQLVVRRGDAVVNAGSLRVPPAGVSRVSVTLPRGPAHRDVAAAAQGASYQVAAGLGYFLYSPPAWCSVGRAEFGCYPEGFYFGSRVQALRRVRISSGADDFFVQAVCGGGPCDEVVPTRTYSGNVNTRWEINHE